MRHSAARSRRPILVLGSAGVAAALMLSGCAAGQDAQTVEQTSVVDGTAFQAGQIDLRDVGVRAPSTGELLVQGGVAHLEGVMINSGTADDQLVSVSSPVAGSVAFYPDGVSAVLGVVPAPSTSASASGSPSASGSASATATTSGTRSSTASASGTTSASGTSTSSSSASSTSSASSAPSIDSIDVAPNEAVRFGYETSQVQIVLLDLTEDLNPSVPVQLTFTFAKAGSVTATVAVKLIVDQTSDAPSIDTGKEGE